MAVQHPPVSHASSRLFMLVGALFISYLAVSTSMPVVAGHVVGRYGFSNLAAGFAVGIAFLATILTRSYAGNLSDLRGGKYSTLAGLVLYCIASLVCAVSNAALLGNSTGYSVLILGRVLLGIGESLSLVGIVSWGIALVGPQHSGRALALIGMGMYGAFVFGPPAGFWLERRLGFSGLMIVCSLLTLASLASVCTIQAVPPQAGQRTSFWRIMRLITREGAVVCLQGIGFAGLGAFFALYAATKGWEHAQWGLAAFGIGFVAVRILFGHLPDKMNGYTLAICALTVECAGQLLIFLAPDIHFALAGALLTGMGCSIVFPAMGVEVVKRVPPHLRGTAMGGFAACQDIAYGVTAPLAGALADQFGYGVVFVAGAAAAMGGLIIALLVSRK